MEGIYLRYGNSDEHLLQRVSICSVQPAGANLIPRGHMHAMIACVEREMVCALYMAQNGRRKE